MAINNSATTGKSSKTYNGEPGAPVRAIVKNNVDATRSGRIDVYIGSEGGIDPNNSDNWVGSVQYLSPFLGFTGGSSGSTGDGQFVGNPQSYGFWASAPDIGTEVICIFADAERSQGYYIGCVPRAGSMAMTPAIGSSDIVVPNASEATTYGGCDRAPTSEVNTNNPSVKDSATIYDQPKPVHSYQAAILSNQGLIRDNIRGPISSSAQRESPSRVFGISTPGGPIYEGGFTNQTITEAAKTADPTKLKQVGRTGGHTFVMDDGKINGEDQLIRLRSSTGHQITMSDSGETLFIIHANGDSWIELGKEGTIDMYSKNSVNVRTKGDLNFHADQDVNINAKKNLNIYAGENINIEAAKNYSQRTGANHAVYTIGKYDVKVDGAIKQQAGATADYISGSTTTVFGSQIQLNPSGSPSEPTAVPPMVLKQAIDTMRSPDKGWIQGGATIPTITTRTPTHQPWTTGNATGTPVREPVSETAPSGESTPATNKVNDATPAAPSTPVTAAQVAAAPAVVTAAAGPITPDVAKAMTAQVAATAQASGAAVLNQVSGATAQMAEAAGDLKKGASSFVDSKIAQGLPQAKALTGVVTGATDVKSLITNATVGASIVGVNIQSSASSLLSKGIITGSESAASAAGLVMGAVTNGVSAVADFAKSGITSVTGLANSIAGGKFAAGLADSLSFSGLKTSLGGLSDGIKGAIGGVGGALSGIGNNLKSAVQNAFAAAEASFTNLRAGLPNVLGPASTSSAPTKQPSDVTLSANSYASAEAEETAATDALFAAKRDYRNAQTPATTEALQKAEAALSAAVQKKAQASSQFLKSSVGGIAAGATGALSTVATTLNSGLNAIPGGAAVFQSAVNASPIGGQLKQASTALGAVNTALSSVGGIAANASKLAGNLVGNTNKMVGDAMKSATGIAGDALSKVKAGAAGVMAQLQTDISSALGSTPIGAVSKIDLAAVTAKTGQLLGDSRIPLPTPPDSSLPPSNPTRATAEITTALEAVTDAQNRVRAAKLNLASTRKLGGTPEAIATAQAGLVKEEEALAAAQQAYSSLVT